MSDFHRPAGPSAGGEETRKIYPNVRLGKNVTIGDFCVIGYPPRGKEPGELETVIGDNTVIRSHSVIYAGTRIGRDCHVGHMVFIREETEIGDRCSIGGNSYIEHHCVLGTNVRIQGQAGLCEHTICEDDVWVGPRVITANTPHPTCDRAKECLAGPVFRRGAIIGAAAAVAPDVEVGRRAFVGMGAVVLKSVPDGAIVLGNPARRVSNVDNITCPYDMMGGRSPYVPAPKEDSSKKIPLVDLAAQHQSLKMDLRRAIDTVILNTRFINGKEVREFESAFAEFCGVAHAVGVGSGTDALFLALKALGVGPGDEVVTVANSFIATPEAILALGAVPVFVDIDPETCNIAVDRIPEKITERTKAIVPVHLYGRPADMEGILAIARERGLKVVADAAQAHGAELAGRPVAQWGDAVCFSFYPGKNLGAYGDAGAVVTQDADLADRIARLKDHGRKEKYTHTLVGVNSRLDTIQAAVLKTKLPHLGRWNEARRDAARRYREGLEGLPLSLPCESEGATSVYHLFVVQTDERDRLQAHLRERNIATGVHYPVPLPLQPSLADLGHRPGDFPATEAAARRILSLPMYPELTEDQVARVIAEVRAFFQ